MQKLSVIAFRKHVLVIALSLCTFLLCATAASAAWSGPPAGTPPNNCTTGYPGCDAPINISGTAQSKQAGLLLNTQGAANGLLMYGNLGVGTLTPASRLTVVGDIRASTGGSLLFDTAAGNTRGYLKAVEAGVDGGAAGGAGLILATSGGEGIAIKGGGTSGTTFMAIAGNGNVGIGTASPGTTRLNVQKSGDGEWAGIIANTMNSGGPKGLLVLTGQNGSNAALQVANNTLAAPIPVFTVTGGGSATLNGQMNAASYCIAGANCITAWPSAVAEADTLATVVARGNSTTNAIAVANITDSNNNNYYIDPNNTSVFNDIRSTQARSSVWYDNDNTNYTI
ncbi:hypothetical protein H7X87_01305, partial [Acetobacteraceae bacterium]|nr:hypothetical protein [Candidatus Parcubacteria bacterium]